MDAEGVCDLSHCRKSLGWAQEGDGFMAMVEVLHLRATDLGAKSESCSRQWQALSQGRGGQMGLWAVPSPP